MYVCMYYVCMYVCMSVGISTKLQAAWPRYQGSIPGRGQIFFFSQTCTDQLLGPTDPPVKWVKEAFSHAKVAG